MLGSISFQRGVDPLRFRDHGIDQHSKAVGLFVPEPAFDLTRQLHQAHRAKMTAAALDRVYGRRNSGTVVVAHLQTDCAYPFAQVGKEYIDDLGDKLLAQFIAFGELGNRAHVDRGNARGFNAHSFSSGSWFTQSHQTRTARFRA